MRTPESWKSRPDMPGNWFMMLPSGPILSTAWNCSRMSRNVHCPLCNRFIISGACIASPTSARTGVGAKDEVTVGVGLGLGLKLGLGSGFR